MSKDIGFLRIDSRKIADGLVRITVIDNRKMIETWFDIPYPTEVTDELAFAILCDIVSYRKSTGSGDSLALVSNIANMLNEKTNETLCVRIFLAVGYAKIMSELDLNEADIWYLQYKMKEEQLQCLTTSTASQFPAT